MSLITAAYFVGEINIPNTNNAAVASKLDVFIKKYEAEFLLKALGPQTSVLFTAGLEAEPMVEPWIDLKLGVAYTDVAERAYTWRGLYPATAEGAYPISPVANYIYYHFMRNEASQTTMMGEKMTQAENAADWSPREKMIRAWNEMSDWVTEMNHYLRTNNTLYPLWYTQYAHFWRGNVFGKINQML